MGVYLIVSLKIHKKLSCNAVGTTLVLNALAGIPLFTWPMCYFVTAIQTGKMFRETLSAASLPTIAIFFIAACFNISLMWLQVGKSATSLSSSGSNIAKSTIHASRLWGGDE